MENILIKDGFVIDPEKKEIEKKDIYVRNGLISEKFENPNKIINAMGLYVSPGFIDMHTHVFENYTPLGINADKVGVEQGVCTIVDAGSVGIRDFHIFKEKIVDKAKTHVKFFLNIARQGLSDGLSELEKKEDLITPDELENFIKENGENLVGLKVRMSSSVLKGSGLNPLIYAKELSNQFSLPLMVHIGNAPPALGDVLNVLQKGDIITHFSHGKKGGVLDFQEEFLNAIDRGVYFDIGHGTSSFSYEVLPKILALRDLDYSISTDIYNSNFEKPVGSLMDTMSKFLNLPLPEVVYKVTTLPSKVLGLKLGINIGDPADITIFSLENKERELVDSEGYLIKVSQYLKPSSTIMKGVEII